MEILKYIFFSSFAITLVHLHVGTFDIQNITASSPFPGQIQVTGYYIDGSTATGVVLIVYSLTNESDVQYIVKEKCESNNIISINVTGLSRAEYSLSVFALEDGIPFPRVVTLPIAKNVTVAANRYRGL